MANLRVSRSEASFYLNPQDFRLPECYVLVDVPYFHDDLGCEFRSSCTEKGPQLALTSTEAETDPEPEPPNSSKEDITPLTNGSGGVPDGQLQPLDKPGSPRHTISRRIERGPGDGEKQPSDDSGRKGKKKNKRKSPRPQMSVSGATGQSHPSMIIATEETSTGNGVLEFSRLYRVLNVWKAAAQGSQVIVIGLLNRDFSIKTLMTQSVPQTGSRLPMIRRNDHASLQNPSYSVQRDDMSRHDSDHWSESGFDNDKITKLVHASEYSGVIQMLSALLDNLPHNSQIPARFIIGVAHFKMSAYKSAQQYFRSCEEEALKARRNGDVMLCNAYLGDIDYASQLYLSAADHYHVAIKFYAEGSVARLFKLTPPTLSAIHAKCASSFRNASRMVEAVHEYKIAIEKAQINRDRLSAHTSLGNLYQSMGDNSSALEQYKLSIELATKLSDYVSLGWAHGNIGNAYLGLNKKDEAVYHLQKSLDLAVEYEQTPQAIGRTYNNLGTAYQSMNDLDKAEEYYDLALSQAIYGDDIPGQARVYGNIGNIHMLRKNYEQAIPHYSEVLRLSSDPSTVGTAQHNRGCAYYEWATSLHKSVKFCSQDHGITFHNHECDTLVCLEDVPTEAKGLYRKGRDDLEEVVKHHEQKFQHIKGSPKGLTLSVSLFESNSRTFHRLQDCLVNLHEWEKALVVAEKSRARTLGEMMLKRKEHLVEHPISSPLTFELASSITKRQQCPLVYLSYTGARLLGWVFTFDLDKVSMNTFAVPLDDDQFDGKSFDYYLRYTLTEKLVEWSFEMYQSITYDERSSSSVQLLHSLIAAPIVKLLSTCNKSGSRFSELILISDSYTSLLPLTCLFDAEKSSFFGDYYYIRSVPSLLTLGVMSQMSEVVVNLQEDQREFCVIGDPNIPPFHYNGEIWTLGKLPFARREAEWVAHTLGTTPILNELATKSALLIRLMKAKVVHIATHGSASAGFLAFAAFMVKADGSSLHVRGENVLLFPQDIEKLNISPALVVLSSCDSGRGTVKADGIQGMARAFILAGAQSVLTTLWKVPDESASVFMQFFYQYLLDGLKSSLALHKAILSVRCFAKYSQYIHWSGYQLTGQDIHFFNKVSDSVKILKKRLGSSSVFPRLADVKKLRKAFLDNPSLPTDIQIIQGSPGVQPSEVVVDFVTSCHSHFDGGIYWINCCHQKMLEASIDYIEKEIGHELVKLPLSEKLQALLVLDGVTILPDLESFLRVMKHQFVHVVVLPKSDMPVDKLIKEVDQKLIRGCMVHNIEPLTVIHSTQRLVHHVMSSRDYVPTNGDQQTFESLAEFTLGSPVIIDIASQVLLYQFEIQCNALEHIAQSLSLQLDISSVSHEQVCSTISLPVRAISENLDRFMHSSITILPKSRDIWETTSNYDSWDSILQLIELCELSSEERLLLNCLTVLNYGPIPFTLVTELASVIAVSSQKPHFAGTLHHKLLKYNLIKNYPLPIVLHSSCIRPDRSPELEPDFIYVPRLLSSCVWKNMNKIDQIAALTLVDHIIRTMCSSAPSSSWLSGICSLFCDTLECSFDLIGKDCYQELFGHYLQV